MKRTMNLLLITILVVLLTSSQSIYCEDFTEIDLIRDAKRILSRNPASYYNVVELGPFPIPLAADQDHTVNLLTPLDIEIDTAYMRLSLSTEEEPCAEEPIEEMPIDVTIVLGNEALVEIENLTDFDFEREMCGEENCSKKLTDFIKETLEAKQEEGGNTCSIPIIFSSRQGGKIICAEFTVKYKVNPVEELEVELCPDTGMPKYFFWKSSAGSAPRYELQIRPGKDFSSSSEIWLEPPTFFGAIYRLTEKDALGLKSKLELGKTYSWGARVVYGEDDKIVRSPWAPSTFTVRTKKPSKVRNIRQKGIDDNVIKSKITFSWDDDPDNADNYSVALNGHIFEEEPTETSFTIDKSEEYLCCSGWNTLTVWAIRGSEQSEPEEFEFYVMMERVNTPQGLCPDSGVVKEKEVEFDWERVAEVKGYEFQLFDSRNPKEPLKIPTEIEGIDEISKLETATVTHWSYEPWNETKYKEDAGLPLIPGHVYMFKVRAMPYEGDRMPSEWATQVFLYDPVHLWMLMLCAAIGGLVGGFIRIANEERKIASKENRRMKIPLDPQTYLGFVVGVIVGVIFYLIINLTLSTQLNNLGIPPFDYPGSLLLGFLGGLISYEIIRLKPSLPSKE